MMYLRLRHLGVVDLEKNKSESQKPFVCYRVSKAFSFGKIIKFIISHFFVYIAFMLLWITELHANSPLLSVPKSGHLDFEVIRNGKTLGSHKFKFKSFQQRLEVRVSSEIEYRLFSIPFYTHSHKAKEVWRNGNLISMEAETNDDGEVISISAEAVNNWLTISSSQGLIKVPRTVKPASFWSARAVHSDTLFSTLRGGILKISVEHIRDEVIQVKGMPRLTKHYKMVGGVERDLWFDPSDNMALVYLKFEAKDGSTVEYKLR